MSQHDSMVQTIVTAHADLALAPGAGTSQRAATATFTCDAAAYRAAKSACLALGFIEADAECVALAWQNQTDRSGHFDVTAWPDQPEDFGMQAWPRPTAFAACPRQLGLYAVLPDAAWVGRMARAGVSTVQLRFKSDDTVVIAREVRAAVMAVKGTNARLFINDHWQAAIDAGAYGVHLGQEDMVEADLEKIRAAGLRLGLSSHGYAEMLRADHYSPSYIAMGAVFATTLKRMQTPPQGLARLGAYARLMRDYPKVAIGGIDASKLLDVLNCGVGSIAVVRALVAAENPEVMANSLQAKINARLSAMAPEPAL
ncbi:thiamine phosphate synthase [Rhodoferax ferrireducens]|uniref:thiamine phosphate synthase n=1 Tax=Rhodoferax ferrireducens TaxID=192843 RepID=UPI00298DB6FF|nr:thiamine phosphate synthase [Rhodoferax ferrireducens]WPC65352.1 thiamine phosphate synthase [Rhodoferax ferrireducens]